MYSKSFLISANTTATSPSKLEMVLGWGVVVFVSLSFPGGCAGLVGVHINRALHQIWPVNQESWFIADKYTIGFKAAYLLLSPPFQFEIYGYNTDDTNDHTIEVRFNILTPWAYLRQPQSQWDAFGINLID